MAGHIRFRDGAWRLTADAGKNALGKRVQIHETVHAPNTKAGRKKAELARAALVLKGAEQASRTTDETMALAAFLAGWIERRSPDWAPSTRATDPGIVARHITPHLGDIRLTDLRRRHVAAWHAELTRRGCAPASVGKYHRILHRALADAVALELIPANPASGVAPPKVPDSTKRAPTDTELDAIIAAIDDAQFRVILEVDAIIGSRRGEVCALRWSDIDLDTGAMRVTRALSNGGAEEGLVERQTKTGAKGLKMLDDVTLAALREHRDRRAEQCAAVGAPMVADGFVFVPDKDPTGARPLRPDRITAMFTRARVRAGVTGVTFHDLRRYVASHLLDSGMDVQTTAAWLGHSASVTLNVYGAPVNNDRRVAETLRARRGSGS